MIPVVIQPSRRKLYGVPLSNYCDCHCLISGNEQYRLLMSLPSRTCSILNLKGDEVLYSRSPKSGDAYDSFYYALYDSVTREPVGCCKPDLYVEIQNRKIVEQYSIHTRINWFRVTYESELFIFRSKAVATFGDHEVTVKCNTRIDVILATCYLLFIAPSF